MKKITHDDYMLIFGLHDSRSVVYETNDTDSFARVHAFSRYKTYLTIKRVNNITNTGRKMTRNMSKIINAGWSSSSSLGS